MYHTNEQRTKHKVNLQNLTEEILPRSKPSR